MDDLIIMMEVYPVNDSNFNNDCNRLFSIPKKTLLDSADLLKKLGKNFYDMSNFEKLLKLGLDRPLINLQIFIIMRFMEYKKEAPRELAKIISDEDKSRAYIESLSSIGSEDLANFKTMYMMMSILYPYKRLNNVSFDSWYKFYQDQHGSLLIPLINMKIEMATFNNGTDTYEEANFVADVFLIKQMIYTLETVLEKSLAELKVLRETKLHQTKNG